MKSIYQIRQENLKEILRRDFDDNQSRLAEALGTQQNLVSRWENGKKNIGTNAARKIEKVARRDAFWLDVDRGIPDEEPESEIRSQIGAVAAENLRRWMSEHPTLNTQQRLADKSGISQPTIYRLLRTEAGITINNLAMLAEAFGRSAYELLMPQNAPGVINYDHAAYAALPAAEKDKIRSFIEFVISQNAK